MKKTFILLQASIIVLMLTFISQKASAQATLPGPSTPGPYASTVTPANGFVCLGGTINLTAVGTLGNRYTWYKKSPTTGLPVLVQPTGAVNAATYSEISTTEGYYTYYVEQTNPNDCVSPMSNPINIYVLPAITAAIAGGAPYCENALPANLNLTITGLDPLYSYTYQWIEDGVDVSGATNPSYPVTNIIPGTHAYKVRVNYNVTPGLTTPCPFTSSPKSIIVYQKPGQPSITVN